METRAGQPPEGRLIEEARERLNISQNKAAKRAGLSGTRWRQIVYGEASGGPGITNPVVGSPETIAKMAQAVNVTAEQLAEVGREDAGEELRRITVPPPPVRVEPSDAQLVRLLEIWVQFDAVQRRAAVGVLEEILRESSGPGGKPEQADERRTA